MILYSSYCHKAVAVRVCVHAERFLNEIKDKFKLVRFHVLIAWTIIVCQMLIQISCIV